MAMVLPRKHRVRPGRIVLTAIAIAISLAFLVPVVWLFASALRPANETFASSDPLTWHVLWPQHWTLTNVRHMVTSGFLRALLNSLVVAVATVVIGLLVSAMAAFALAALKFRGRGVVFAVVVVSFLVPFDSIAIPLANIFTDWHLTNSLVGLVLPGLGNGIAVFTLRQFFLGVPTELSEAARIDGAGWWRIFARIYVPLCKPAMIGAGLTLFLFQWQAYLWPVLTIADNDKAVAPVAIAKSFNAFQSDYGAVFVETAVLGIVPAIVLLSLQRYFTASIAATGSKE